MSWHRRRAMQKDKTHKPIVDGLRNLGFVVFDVSGLAGLGFDIVVFRLHELQFQHDNAETLSGEWRVFEIKTPVQSQAGERGTRKYSIKNRPVKRKAPITKSEVRAAQVAPIPCVSSIEDALKYF